MGQYIAESSVRFFERCKVLARAERQEVQAEWSSLVGERQLHVSTWGGIRMEGKEYVCGCEKGH